MNDEAKVGEIVRDMLRAFGRRTDDGLLFWLDALRGYDPNAVQAAIMVVVRDRNRDSAHPPTPAEVLAVLEGPISDGHPEPNEAWAMVSAVFDDEAESAVLTEPMAQAWGIAAELAPDKVAARVAFLRAYERIVAEFRAANRPPAPFLSRGTDRNGHRAAVQRAIDQRLIPTHHPLAKIALAAPEPVSDPVVLIANAARLAPPASRERAREAVGGLLSLVRSKRAGA
ncbi:MAG: hypothetical protein R3E87_15020 [Burkholderiaceae bacterium]